VSTRRIVASEVLAGFALVLKIAEYIAKQITWGEGKSSDEITMLFSYLSIAFLLASVLLWLQSSNKKLDKLEEIGTQLDGFKSELDRLENSLAEKSKSSAELEELFHFRRDRVSADNMRKMWTSLLWKVQEDYWATNYILDSEIYLKGYADSAFAIQEAKIKAQHVNIKKVFIVKDEAELQSMQPIFKRQSDLGIRVKYIIFDAIEKDPSLKVKAAKLDTIDFGLIDSRITLLWFLNDQRAVEGGQVALGVDQVMIYKDFFETLFTEAKQFH
jgi:hypothetical protein